MTTTSPSALELEASWVQARAFANLLNPIPPAVVRAIQTLWANHLDNLTLGSATISPQSVIALKAVDKSSKLRTPLYFAAASLYPDQMETIQEDDTTVALLRVLGPGFFATLLGLVYLHRRLNKICRNAEWQNLSKEYVLNMELGFYAGSAFTRLGTGEGTLVGGIRYAAMATLLLRTPDYFIRYRNLKRKRIDLEHEQSLWGCDITQIGACLIKNLGFRKDLLEVGAALRGDLTVSLPDDLRRWRAAIGWIDAMKAGTPPDPEHWLALDSDPSQVQELTARTNKLLRDGSTFTWMLQRGDVRGEDPAGAP